MRGRAGAWISGVGFAFTVALLLGAGGCQQDQPEVIEVRRGATTLNPLLYPYCSASGCAGGVTFNQLKNCLVGDASKVPVF